MESGIRAKFAAQGVTVHDVSCPDDVEAKVGARVSCTARNAAGTKLFVDGRVTSVRGDHAHFHFEAAHGIASGRTMATQVRALLEHQVGQRAAGMTCPPQVRIPTTTPVICRLTTQDGTVYDTKVTVDAHGGVHAQVADTPASSH